MMTLDQDMLSFAFPEISQQLRLLVEIATKQKSPS